MPSTERDRNAYDPKNEFRAKLVDALGQFTKEPYEKVSHFVDGFLDQNWSTVEPSARASESSERNIN
jgi:hypothetical protein